MFLEQVLHIMLDKTVLVLCVIFDRKCMNFCITLY